MKIFQSFAGFMEKILPLLFSRLTTIPNGADLNDYKTSGYTFQGGAGGASTGLNYPVTLAGQLEIKDGSNYVYQVYQTATERFQRTYRAQDNTWLPWIKEVNESSGTAPNSGKLNNLTADNFLTLGKTENVIWNTGSASIEGAFTAKGTTTTTDGVTHNTTKGSFHKESFQEMLDNKTSWLLSTNTRHSGSYVETNKIGLHRSGTGWSGQGFIFQHTGNTNNTPLSRFYMDQQGVFGTKDIVLNKDISENTGSTNYSEITFRRKQPQSTRQRLGSIMWDSFRDVSDPSYVAGIWAEGAGTAGNSGELHFGTRDNGTADSPNSQMKLTASGVEVMSQFTTTLMSTVSIKCRDVVTAIADMARDWDGVSTLLRWKNYGNGHVIFDASKGIAPNGAVVNSINTTGVWQQSYPNLMGWNGVSTFGVRVDSARTADLMTDGSFGVPIGMIMAWPTIYIPNGWLSLDGRSTAGYPILANLFGPNLPNYNGTSTEGGLFLSSARQGRGPDPHNAVSGKVGAHEHGIPFSNGGFLSYEGGGGQPGVNFVSGNSSATSGGTYGNTYPTHIVVNWVVRAG